MELNQQSTSASMELLDLQDRFDQLFNDYTKTRAQNVMLRKAMADMQSTSKSDKLTLQTHEQTLKTMRRDLDTLQLHNQRLVRRIESMKSASGSSDVGAGRKILGGLFGSSSYHSTSIESSSQRQLEVISDELRAKIEENARLHSLLKEQEDSFALQLDESFQECEKMRRQVFDMKEELTSVVLKGEDQLIILRRRINELETENTRLTGECEALRSNTIDKSVVDDLQSLKSIHQQTLRELDIVKSSFNQEQHKSMKLESDINDLQAERDSMKKEHEKSLENNQNAIEDKNREISKLEETISSMQSEISELNSLMSDMKQQPPVTITEPAVDGIVLNLTDYWQRTTTDQQMDREQLLKRYYEDKMKSMFQGKDKPSSQFESQYFDITASQSKTDMKL